MYVDTCIYTCTVHVVTDLSLSLFASFFPPSGPSDIHLSGEDTARLSVTGLHIDQSQGSPTTYTFNFTMRDYANLTSTDTAVLTYYKGQIFIQSWNPHFIQNSIMEFHVFSTQTIAVETGNTN